MQGEEWLMKDECGNEIEPLSKEELDRIGLPKDEPYDVKTWKPIYTKILVMLQKGMTVRQIAEREEIGLKEAHLRRIMRSATFRLKMSTLTEKMDLAIIDKATQEMAKTPEIDLAKIKLLGAAEMAADTIIKLLNPRSVMSKKISIHERRLLATLAQDVLDRVGLKAVAHEDTSRGRDYSPDEIKTALANAKELEDITTRLGNGASRYVLPRGASEAVEVTDALAPTDAVETEDVPFETNATEETVAVEEEG